MRLSLRNRQQGSTLVVVMIACLTVGTVVASYLALIASRHKVTMRSQCWNASIPVLEAGVEEALAHLYSDAASPGTNGWTPTTIGGQAVYTKTRTLPGGSYYFVTLYNANSNNPIIYSTGYVPSPLQSGTYISRTVKVTATNAPTIFSRGIASLGTVTLANNSVVDGYNSGVGPYNPATNRAAVGGIATDSSASSAVNVGGAHVYGSVVTGPGGTVSVGSGAVGDVDWNASHNGIQPGWTNNNMNVAYPASVPPSGGPFLPPPIVSGGGSNVTALAKGTYQLSSFSTSQAGQPMVVTGDATLYVTGDFKISGQGYLYIAPGASLTLYVGGSTSIAGGGVVNDTMLPPHFHYIGLPSNTSISLTADSAFYGSIYAPQADVTLSGSADAFGAVICKSLNCNGSGSFHYDRVLAYANGFVVTGWTEL